MAGANESYEAGEEVELTAYEAQRYAEAGIIDMPDSTIEKVEKPKKAKVSKKGKPKKNKV